MNHQSLWIECNDASPLYLNHWSAQRPAKAVIMLAHGMSEHSGRYARLAEALTAEGIELYAHDQRGHGKTAEHGVAGHFADKDGWQLVIRDLERINHHIRRDHPQTPIILLGHSMGSYIGMAYLMRHSCSVQGAILSGSNYQPVALYKIAEKLARFERWRQGPLGRSALIEFVSFGSFNKRFKPNRTAFDWLSRDPQEVDTYINDPLCGKRCSNQLWIDLLGGLQSITPPENLAQIDSKLPLLVIGGSCDPVSQGQRQLDLANALRQSGHMKVQVQLYPEARHELLNETNRDEATRYIINWLLQVTGLMQQSPSAQERQQ
ncbi:lysophospholipase [Ectopseudomonas mendocina]|uniref:Lysophospholipase n=1 Tax=Ectopseudomonas mendocina TaxID=300 RepID=A0ABZ2RLM9_ECTME